VGKFIESKLSGVFKYSPVVYFDLRGSITEWFNSQHLPLNFNDFSINQLLTVKNQKNVIRGIHFSDLRNVQSKILKCSQGVIMDVVVDFRVDSSTFGKHEMFILDSELDETLFIPHGFGHAYQVLSDSATIEYALQTQFKFEEEYVLNPYDKTIGIVWEGKNHILSPKDKNGADFETYFGRK